MAYALLSSTSATLGGSSYDFEVYEDGFTGTAQTLKIVSDPILEWGETMPSSIFKPHLPLTAEFRVKDDSSFLLGRFAGKTDTDFQLKIKKAGSVIACGPIDLDRINDPVVGMTNPVFTLRMYDGLTLLQNIEYNESGWQSCAETYRACFDQASCDLDLFTYMIWEHDNQATGSPDAAGFRFHTDYWELEESPTNYFSVLERLSAFLQTQFAQVGGGWRVLERYYRTGAMDYVKVDTADTVTTGSETKSVTLSNSDIIWKKSKEVSTSSIKKITSTYRFNQDQIENGDLEVWDDSFSTPIGWNEPGGGVERVVSSTGEAGAEVDVSSDILRQDTTEAVRTGDNITISIDLEYSLLDTGTTAPVGRVVLMNTLDGTDRYLDAAGNWSTTAQDIEDTLDSSGGQYSTTIETNPPVAGTLTLITRFSRDPDEDGTEEYDYYIYREFSYEVERFNEYYQEQEYSSSAATYGEIIEEEFFFGGFLDTNPAAGVIEYLDDTSGAWEKAVDWDSSTSGDQALHSLRTSRRAAQQDQLLKGLDLQLSPDVEVDITDTITYDSVQYVPVYVRLNLRKRTRRVIAYELRTA